MRIVLHSVLKSLALTIVQNLFHRRLPQVKNCVPKYVPKYEVLEDLPSEVLVDLTPKRPAIRSLGQTSSFDHPRDQYHRSTRKPAAKTQTNTTWLDRTYDQRPEHEPLKPGAYVRHVRYGVGKVVGTSPGSRLKVAVEFPGWGVKTIIADYLEPD